jgi:hypothetical protein
LVCKLRLEEGRERAHVSNNDQAIVEGETNQAGCQHNWVPEGGLQEKLVYDDVDDDREGDR